MAANSLLLSRRQNSTALPICPLILRLMIAIIRRAAASLAFISRNALFIGASLFGDGSLRTYVRRLALNSVIQGA